MYQKILVALENSPSDEAVLSHVGELAKIIGAKLLLLHVAEGFAARNFEQLALAESQEMKEDRAYLQKVQARLEAQGLSVDSMLALGNPPNQIVNVAEHEGCDLIALTGHGHRFVNDLIHGSTIEPVRHKTKIPVLVVRSEG